jgi:hypothetical protein
MNCQVSMADGRRVAEEVLRLWGLEDAQPGDPTLAEIYEAARLKREEKPRPLVGFSEQRPIEPASYVMTRTGRIGARQVDAGEFQ